MNTLELLKESYLKSSEEDQIAEIDMSQIRSNSYYSLKQVKMMEDIAIKLGFITKGLDNSSKVIREAIQYLFDEIETGNFTFSPKLEENKTPKLKNCKMTKAMIAKCKRFSKVFNITNGQFRREAIEHYHDAVMNDKLKTYSVEKEVLANIRNDEAEYGKK